MFLEDCPQAKGTSCPSPAQGLWLLLPSFQMGWRTTHHHFQLLLPVINYQMSTIQTRLAHDMSVRSSHASTFLFGIGTSSGGSSNPVQKRQCASDRPGATHSCTLAAPCTPWPAHINDQARTSPRGLEPALTWFAVLSDIKYQTSKQPQRPTALGNTTESQVAISCGLIGLRSFCGP